ncbi:TetR/AcrR family transcriptional repressor of nem operon [Novosphingobium sp. SG751A]|uniref:TetR/AcrR family transcriptional regulator n=1 Tax=Novosphingobium sp. SG751A TaxID=2587000 RepID=UPI00155210D3|nr:TetR/AcrR family transcriptional regulator [Novosphingobium sp. SG751A]NOW46403.1 TetR/AcrR family transcriptional repressor of nem operon [Novosphingobium sp. SG751A]
MADKSNHKAKVRERILDEAAAALRAAGTEGLSVAGLMKRAGLTHGGFYAHFENRDDLVAHAIGRMFQDSAGMLARFLGEKPDLDGLVDHYLSEQAMRRHDRGCPLPWLAGEAPRMPHAARERFQQGIGAMTGAIAAALEKQGKDRGRAAHLASSAVAEMVGALALARALGDGDQALATLAAARASVKDRLSA